MGKSYKKLLRDPRWQKKRLKVFKRAGWACERCGNAKEELHVHHHFYDGRKPWKYPKESLECLCKTCHKEEHEEDTLPDCPVCESNHKVEYHSASPLPWANGKSLYLCSNDLCDKEHEAKWNGAGLLFHDVPPCECSYCLEDMEWVDYENFSYADWLEKGMIEEGEYPPEWKSCYECRNDDCGGVLAGSSMEAYQNDSLITYYQNLCPKCNSLLERVDFRDWWEWKGGKFTDPWEGGEPDLSYHGWNKKPKEDEDFYICACESKSLCPPQGCTFCNHIHYRQDYLKHNELAEKCPVCGDDLRK